MALAIGGTGGSIVAGIITVVGVVIVLTKVRPILSKEEQTV